MRRTARLFRFGLVVLATVQVTAPAGAALADAVVDSYVLGPHGHESRPHHDNCIFCQLLGQAAITSQVPVPPRPAERVAYVPPVAPAAPVRELLRHLPHSRAPPLA